MKYLLILLVVFTYGFSNTLSQRLDKLVIDKNVKKITSLKYNPFYVKQKKKHTQIKNKNIFVKKTFKKIKLRLISILNNKAFINDRWLVKGDKIYGYIIKKILNDRVVLEKKKKKIVLNFQKNKDILKVRKK